MAGNYQRREREFRDHDYWYDGNDQDRNDRVENRRGGMNYRRPQEERNEDGRRAGEGEGRRGNGPRGRGDRGEGRREREEGGWRGGQRGGLGRRGGARGGMGGGGARGGMGGGGARGGMGRGGARGGMGGGGARGGMGGGGARGGMAGGGGGGRRGGGARGGMGGGRGRGGIHRPGEERHDDEHNTGQREAGQNGHSSSQFFTQEDVERLAQSTSEEVFASAVKNEPKFLAAYKFAKFCDNPKVLKCLIKLLYLLAEYEDKDLATSIIARIFNTENTEYSTFLVKLNLLLKGMQLEIKPYVRQHNPLYINYLVEVGLVAIQSIPRTVVYSFPLAVIQETVLVLAQQKETVDRLLAKVQELDKAFTLARSELLNQRGFRKENVDSSDSLEIDPPEPFTELPILPATDEIHSCDSEVFLRSNLAKGGYKSWEHYLDIQFRLLREDFIQPLRNGINQYCDTGSGKKNKDVYIYEKVNVLQPVCLVSGIGFQIQFDISRYKRLNWEHSKRLIFGSLLCLSSDDFDKRILFASVAKRDASQLKKGFLTIKFEGDVNGFLIDPNESFVMVESTAYFEAYRHILESLQLLSKSPDIIPMKQYIVDCQLGIVGTPKFLKVEKPSFNLKRVLDVENAVVVTDHGTWPAAENTCLNDAQLNAFEMALTKEMCIIQGPPGTGKTFVGLKIVEAYLRNRHMWDPDMVSPILVVCYTNHALDQFLEGILNFSIDDRVPNIVRVGGRCKSEKLADCILTQRVQVVRSKRILPNKLHKSYVQSRHIMLKCQKEIERLLEKCDTSSNKIFTLSTLVRIVPERLADQLRYDRPTEIGKEIEVWLELWYPEHLLPDSAPQEQTGKSQPEREATADEGSSGIPNPTQQDGASDSENDAGLIEVDNEARLLQEERILEGEEVELPRAESIQKPESQQSEKKEDSEWITVQISKAKRRQLISKGLNNKPMDEARARQVRDVWQLPMEQRWELYLHWQSQHIRHCKGKINKHATIYNGACESYNDSKKDIDCHVLNSGRVDVIGMTTTGAAKHHHILKKIYPKIVIFEEAAEIFEAHVVTSLPTSVQQVILIGDHKQLQPKPNCYSLGRDYNFAVSMFERMANNDIDYITLNFQHRMRPEISRLIAPSIYSNLLDHDQVKNYDHVMGVGKNIFFIDHVQPEEKHKDRDTKTHVNKHEAEYLVELCHYLLKQGYPAEDITILTMYRGQLLELRNRMKREQFFGVRVVAVDDYQGEENEIILLSLVRSNNEGKIGFLKIENRICVSLSRAKKGLFIIGNASMLRDKVETVWPAILQDMKAQKCIGKGLPLYCQVHPEDALVASQPGDFRTRLEGGCNRKCGERLTCGHMCTRLCHPTDRRHEHFMCTKKCTKMLPCDHPCKHKCYECKDGCPPCHTLVEKVLPSCGHTVRVACSSDPSTVPCPLPCPKKLPCGHDCQDLCSQPCSKKCFVKILKKFPCEHSSKVPCHASTDVVSCPVPCQATLECGHKCTGTCGSCQQGRLHARCQQKCGRQLVCGHICDFPCGSACPPCLKLCNNYCYHSHCPKQCYEPCDACMEPCKWKCSHHKCDNPCGELCDRRQCDESCNKLLKCGHPCIGLCGEKCPGKCRVCDKDDVQAIYFGTEDEDDARFIQLEDCEHFFEVKSLDKWMREPTTKSQIQFKCCPKCSTPIRKSIRYGNIIKQVLNDIQAIKLKQAKAADDLVPKIELVLGQIKALKCTDYISSALKVIEKDFTRVSSLNLFRVSTLHVQVTLLPKLQNLQDICGKLGPIRSSVNFSGCSQEYIERSSSFLKQFVMQEFLSPQQITDATSEACRLTCSAKLLDLVCKLMLCKCVVSRTDMSDIVDEVKQIHFSGWKHARMTDSREAKVCRLISQLSKKYGVDGLSDQERIQIVKAINLPKGHWYKCPNGHFYCIADCGGATETAICPDCKATIGGTNHELSAGNDHAPEMDNSEYPAWSNEANEHFVFHPNQPLL